MNKYNPKIHDRRSIRLKGYDYKQAGLYFITICVQERECLFGEISDNSILKQAEMKLNDAGKMVEKWYYELENKFPEIKCHEMIVMPNHFHCILEIIERVGSDLSVCPVSVGSDLSVCPVSVGSDLSVCPVSVGADLSVCPVSMLGENIGSPLHQVIQWFKTMTTNEYIRGVKNSSWQSFSGKLWQRNYYEHIIRNEHSKETISNYIISNPSKWSEDKFFVKTIIQI